MILEIKLKRFEKLTDERVMFSALPLKLSEDIIPRRCISSKMIVRDSPNVAQWKRVVWCGIEVVGSSPTL